MIFVASLMNFGGPDLVVILLIVLVLFGAKRLPDLARGMGQAMKEFQKAKDDLSQELRTAGKAQTPADTSRIGSDAPTSILTGIEIAPGEKTTPRPRDVSELRLSD
jgi:sec-independent protein translocase protein TatA